MVGLKDAWNMFKYWKHPKGIEDARKKVMEAIEDTIDFLDNTGDTIKEMNDTIEVIQEWTNAKVDELQKEIVALNKDREEAEQFLRSLKDAVEKGDR